MFSKLRIWFETHCFPTGQGEQDFGQFGKMPAMRTAWAKITVENPARTGVDPVVVDAMADTSALFLCIPDQVRIQLRLEPSSHKEVVTADGTRSLCPYVGPIRVRFEDRECYVGAVVLGDEVLLGAVPMEDMDLVVIPSARRVVVNPLHPDFAAGPAKQTVGLP